MVEEELLLKHQSVLLPMASVLPSDTIGIWTSDVMLLDGKALPLQRMSCCRRVDLV